MAEPLIVALVGMAGSRFHHVRESREAPAPRHSSEACPVLRGAGKLVAALDRQHTRDLLDVMQLMVNGVITPEMRRTFVIYLACRNRPIHELL